MLANGAVKLSIVMESVSLLGLKFKIDYKNIGERKVVAT